MRIDVESGHYEDDEYEPRFSNGSSLCIFPPLIRVEPRKSLSYNKLYQEPLKLTVRKLDGSFFGIEVSKIGTVGELKRAVEAAFDHLPRQGPGRVSWEHVWGQFCLCHEGQKLLIDSDCIGMFGIKDGDELQFIHHATNNMVRIESETEICDSDDEPGISNVQQNSKKYTSVYTEDPEETQEHDVGADGDVISRCEYRISHLFRLWFPYRRLNSPKERTSSSKFSSMLGSFKNCLRFSSNKYEARNKSLKGK